MSTKRVTLKGQTISSAGRLSTLNPYAPELLETLTKHGAEWSFQISDKLTLLVEGLRAGSKATKARTRGALLLSEQEFLTLLERGEVEIETRKDVDRSLTLEAIIGELRGILAQPGSSAGWCAILSLIERCDEARFEEIITYLGPQLSKWGANVCWEVDEKHNLFKGFYPAHWAQSMPETQLCVAPPTWLLEVIQGLPSGRHELARALNFEGMKLNGTLGLKLIEYDGWCDIEALCLGVQNIYSRGFYTKLATSAVMQSLTELCIYESQLTALDEALNTRHYPNLKQLRILYEVNTFHYQESSRGPDHFDRMRDERSWLPPHAQVRPVCFGTRYS